MSQPSGSVPIAGSVLRQPYGHVERGTTLAVQGVPEDVALPVVEEAVRYWEDHLAVLMAEEGYPAFGRVWKGRLRSVIVPGAPDGVTVAAFGTDGRRIDGHAFLAPWTVTRSIATSVGRHLYDAGLLEARIVKPKSRNPPGRMHDASNAVTLVAVLTRVEDLDQAAEQRGALLETAREWACEGSPTTNAQLGHFPIAGPTQDIARLCTAVGEVDGSITLATGTNSTMLRGFDRHHRVLEIGAAGGRLTADGRAAAALELRELALRLAPAVDYAAVVFNWTIGSAAHGVLPRDGGNGTRVADSLVGRPAWFQVLTDDHLRRARGALTHFTALGGGRHGLEVGTPQDWMDFHADPPARAQAGAILAGAMSTHETALELSRTRRRATPPHPPPLDPRPDWAGEVPVPPGSTPESANLTLDWSGRWTFTERWTTPGGTIHATQVAPVPNRPSTGNPWMKIESLRVQHVPSSYGTRCVMWWTSGRDLTVASDVGTDEDFSRLILGLHHDVQDRPNPS